MYKYIQGQRNKGSVSTLSAGAYTTILSAMVDIVRARAIFSIMMESTPESGRCHSVYSVVGRSPPPLYCITRAFPNEPKTRHLRCLSTRDYTQLKSVYKITGSLPRERGGGCKEYLKRQFQRWAHAYDAYETGYNKHKMHENRLIKKTFCEGKKHKINVEPSASTLQ